jgi:hypothetical protein
MSRSHPIILIFCVGCSIASSPIAGHEAAPPKQLFHTNGGQNGLAKLLGTAGTGGSAGRILVGHAGTGMAGSPSLSQLPDAQEPQPDAAIDAHDAGVDGATDAAPPLPDAAQTPPDAALPPPDAGTDAGTLATPGKTCAPCTSTCASHYECTSYATETVCLYRVTNGGGATACPNHPKTNAPPLNPDHVGANTNPICMPTDPTVGGYVPCLAWLQTSPNAGF